MKLRRAPVLLRAVLALALVTVALLFGLSSTDYLTRGQAPAAFQRPSQIPPLIHQGAPHDR